MKNKKLLCSVCFLFTFMSVLWGQSITVKGNVTSKTDGQPVIGASVVEATATANGTITDLDGNFTLSVPANSTLKITYIGYKPVTVKSAAIVNVLLEEDTQMVDEVVVTGYTTQRKADRCCFRSESRRNPEARGEQPGESTSRPRARYEHYSGWKSERIGYRTYSRYRYAEQQRSSLYYRWSSYQSWYARIERKRH